MTDLFLEDKHLKTLLNIFEQVCPHATICAFGSRIKNQAHEGSDLDLSVLDWGGQHENLASLKTALNESDLPFMVDVSDFRKLPKTFQAEIQKKNIIIYKDTIR